MASIKFTLNIVPMPQARPRFTRQGRVYDPTKCKAYKQEVATYAKAAMLGMPPFEGAVALTVGIGRPIPKSFTKAKHEEAAAGKRKPTQKCDLDNYMKAIMDAMNGVVWLDDAQVVDIRASKFYAVEPYITVSAKEL